MMEEFANWLTRVVMKKFMFYRNINVAVGLEHEVLFTDFLMPLQEVWAIGVLGPTTT